MLPKIEEVLAAKAMVGCVELSTYSNFYACTWSLSYVRLVETEPAQLASMPILLAHALWNDPSHPEFMPEEWLQNVSLRTETTQSVSDLLNHALSDFAQRGIGGALHERLCFLQESGDRSAIYTFAPAVDGVRPAQPRRFGPTYQIMWQSNGRYLFLEVHNES